MIYYEDKFIQIRNLAPADAPIIVKEELAQGWNSSIVKYEMRLAHQSEGKSIALVAEHNGNVAGYINVYFKIGNGPFRHTDYPEIVDFGVLEKYRRLGIGTKLMDTAEQIAKEHSDTVCLGVGLHSGYGSAQRMYIKRGYVPDGSGVWYENRVCERYGDCKNNDSLILYMSKKLK